MDYKVQPKDNFYSVGRLFHLAPRVIADYNKMEMSKGLVADKTIRIPVQDTTIAAVDNQTKTVYYLVSKGDNLTKVSRRCHTPEASLKDWNHLQGDKILLGQKLIVGFYKYKIRPAPETGTTETVNANNKNTEDPSKIVKDTIVTEQVVVNNKQEEPVIKDTAKQSNPVQSENNVTDPQDPNEGGYFKPYFDLQLKTSPITKNETVTAGIFKTASGWQDKKYFLLIDKVMPATIIKVINPSNNKVIYAKVLGPVSGIRQNEGYMARISNAAASALQVTEENKFILKIVY